MNVAVKGRRADMRETQSLRQKRSIAVDEVPGLLIAPLDERVFAIDGSRVRVIVIDWRQVGVVFPQLGTWRSHIGGKPSRIMRVQIAHGGRQHHDVTRGLVAA